MALPELLANSPTPGTVAALTTLGATQSSTSSLTFTMVGAAPAALQATTVGQFRAVIDSEIVIFDATKVSTTTWTALTRGAEGSTAATHSSGASVFHYLTGGEIAALLAIAGEPKSGSYFAAPGREPVNTIAPSQGYVFLTPLPVPAAFTISAIGFNVTSGGGTGSVVRVGVYGDTGAMRPGALLIDAGTVATTGTGYVEVALSLPVSPGIVWLAAVAQVGTPPTITATGNSVPIPWTNIAATFKVTGLQNNGGITAGLPDPAGTMQYACLLAGSNQGAPHLIVKAA